LNDAACWMILYAIVMLILNGMGVCLFYIYLLVYCEFPTWT
jgi:hypothetical protein